MALAILFGFAIVMNGSTFAGAQGRFAQKLDLPGSALIPYVPWVVLGGYVAAALMIRTIKRTKIRWVGFVIVTFIANTVIAYPIFLLDYGSTRIPVKDLISQDSRIAFEAKYSTKYVSYSASYEGACIRVPKDQYSPEMAAYVAKLISQQNKPNKVVEAPR